MSESWNSRAFTSAVNRLTYWQDKLIAAQEANDLPRARDAARFIEEYGKLIADMMAETSPGST